MAWWAQSHFWSERPAEGPACSCWCRQREGPQMMGHTCSCQLFSIMGSHKLLFLLHPAPLLPSQHLCDWLELLAADLSSWSIWEGGSWLPPHSAKAAHSWPTALQPLLSWAEQAEINSCARHWSCVTWHTPLYKRGLGLPPSFFQEWLWPAFRVPAVSG